MKVEYVARHYDLNDQVRDFTESKLRKLEKFLQEPIEARVMLETSKHRNRADLRLTHRFGMIQSTEATDEMFDAINLAVDKAEKQARRSNKKFHAKRRRGGREDLQQSWPLAVLDAESLDSGSPKVIKSSQLPIEFMSIDEAASKLAESQHDFIVFRNLDSDEVNVLYRRHDDNYGLISPEF
jgi:putative sigma-54 modulation protein